MLSNNYIRYIIVIIVFVIDSCASVTSPGGGPKDEIAPVLIEASPENQTIQFTGSEIRLEFNEHIQVKNFKEEILITPRLSEDIEVIAKKKSVILRFGEELQENTTYTINFRESIQDITESNPAENLKFAFSTGDYIDSAFIEGSVLNLKRQEPLGGILIGAYFADDTLSIINDPPAYLTISEEDGTFRLSNLKPANYMLYALQDANKNSILDFKSENYGFLSEALQLDTSVVNVSLPITYNDRRDPNLQSARSSGKYFIAKYNKYIKEFTLDSPDSLVARFEDDHQGIRFYNSIGSDSVQAIVQAFDTLGYSTIDTFYVKFPETPRSKDPYTFEVELDPVLKSKKELIGKVILNKPSEILNSDSLRIQLDSAIHISASDSVSWNNFHTELTFVTQLTSVDVDSADLRNMKLLLGKNAFLSIENDSSENTEKTLRWTSTEETGVIEVEVNSNGKGFIVELLDERFKVLEQRANQRKFSFTYLNPSNYILRVLVDENNDGIWSPGNIFEGIIPEPVIIYKKSDDTNILSLKANWVLGPHVININ